MPKRVRLNRVADRLDDVRRRAGIRGTREFWLRLGTPVGEPDPSVVVWKEGDGRERQISYPAAKNYHSLTDPRDPPVYYLTRVAEIFRRHCTLEWLATGSGPRTPAEEVAQEAVQGDPVVAKILSRLGWIAYSEGLSARLVETFSRFYGAEVERAELAGEERPSPEGVLPVFEGILTEPLLRWRGGDYSVTIDPHPDRLAAYVDAQLLAISLATPDGRDFTMLAYKPTNPASPPPPQVYISEDQLERLPADEQALLRKGKNVTIGQRRGDAEA